MILEDSSNSEIGIINGGWIKGPIDYSARGDRKLPVLAA